MLFVATEVADESPVEGFRYRGGSNFAQHLCLQLIILSQDAFSFD